jgi:hypothetical protein
MNRPMSVNEAGEKGTDEKMNIFVQADALGGGRVHQNPTWSNLP